MDGFKEIRWRERFENFEKAFKVLEKYAAIRLETEIEKAGVIQFYVIAFELSWKLLKDYLETVGYLTKSPRDAIKQAFQADIIDNGHVWLDALTSRNLTVHTYDENLANEMVKNIYELYFPEMKKLYDKLKMEL
ncbi:MAG: nucleotidyltransferase substrate binding protein [Syntrophomonadaceae bacterium]|nr:nucleotidyltransferase substrate binding protein [Syntrophomonadaceae bacterium]